jgi:hypothetical protein
MILFAEKELAMENPEVKAEPQPLCDEKIC